MDTSDTRDLASASMKPSASKRKKSTLVAVAFVALAMIVVLAVAVPVTLALLKKNDKSTESTASSSSFSAGSTAGVAFPFPPTTKPTVKMSLRPTASPIMLVAVPVVPPAPTTIVVTTKIPTTTPPTALPKPQGSDSSPAALREPELGSAAGTPYLHCAATSSAAGASHHIVLLHGASFTKEIWDNLGILDQFCSQPTIAVTALDMSFGSYTKLQSILTELATKVSSSSSTSSSPPAVVLVTPSAGGSSVVDWLINGDVTILRQLVNVWVPVAVGSLSRSSVSDDQVSAIVPMSILAIYGNADVSGGRLSQRLATLAGATVVELIGGHPVYRDSPDEFVATILDYIGVVAVGSK